MQSSGAPSGGGGRCCRMFLKLAQLLSSCLLIASVAMSGPQWVLLLATLAVPPFGMILMYRAPDRVEYAAPHKLFAASLKARRWLRVDTVLCVTMAVVFAAFAAVLFYGHAMLSSDRFLLYSAIISIVTAILYLLNALVAVQGLRAGTIDFTRAASVHGPVSKISNTSPLPLQVETLPSSYNNYNEYKAFTTDSPRPQFGQGIGSADGTHRSGLLAIDEFQFTDHNPFGGIDKQVSVARTSSQRTAPVQLGTTGSAKGTSVKPRTSPNAPKRGSRPQLSPNTYRRSMPSPATLESKRIEAFNAQYNVAARSEEQLEPRDRDHTNLYSQLHPKTNEGVPRTQMRYQRSPRPRSRSHSRDRKRYARAEEVMDGQSEYGRQKVETMNRNDTTSPSTSGDECFVSSIVHMNMDAPPTLARPHSILVPLDSRRDSNSEEGTRRHSSGSSAPDFEITIRSKPAPVAYPKTHFSQTEL